MSAAAPPEAPRSTPLPGPDVEQPFSLEQLEAHARELSRMHGAPAMNTRMRPLLASFQATRAEIARAYTELVKKPRRGLERSPAEEWLLDNSHVVQEQLREIAEDLPVGYLRRLPQLARGGSARYPRVYVLALDFIAHTDGRVDLEALVRYITAYQCAAPLTIGELRAVPIMLRLGLAERLLRLAEQELDRARERAAAEDWADQVLTPKGVRAEVLSRALADLARPRHPLGSAFVVQLRRRLREHDSAAGALEWIQERCVEMRTTPDELTRIEHRRQAANQVATGNTITSMRAITALDWAAFVERVSAVEARLREDPAQTYALMDAASRDRCRHAVEDLARNDGVSEETVARAAVELAREAPAGTPAAHVGYYLVDDGKEALELRVGARFPWSERARRALTSRATGAYLSTFAVASVSLVAGLVFVASRLEPTRAVVVLIALALVIPCTEIVLPCLNWLVTAVLPPRLLMKLDLKDGIPPESRTLVVVPALFRSMKDLEGLLGDLEVRALANADDNLHFALLTDFPDCHAPSLPGEDELVQRAVEGVRALNARDPQGRTDRFGLFHRHRIHHARDGRWMGWERKRGKLEELNALLRGRGDGTFQVVTFDRELLESFRYVLTLDADTNLPREVARRLVAAMAHPLNRPVLDETGTRVVRGYGVVQPRVGATLSSTTRSTYARAYAGCAGVDPYTTAISDVYQDLFGEGVYVGKALYDVDAFEAALAGRVPESALLSHDLFEGIHARAALATDIEVLDDEPTSYREHTARQHRWVRGDWQLLPWLMGRVPARGGARRRNDMSAISRWKLLDNLRRSLIAPSIIALLAVAWLAAPRTALIWTIVSVLALGTPLIMRLGTELVRHGIGASKTAWGDVNANALQLGFACAFLLDQAILMVDAIARTLVRLVTRRRLLEWETASEARRRAVARKTPRRMVFASAAAAALAAAVALRDARTLAFAGPILLAWMLAPVVASVTSRRRRAQQPPLSEVDRRWLRAVARKTWRFFETFVTPADHALPPDNYQEDPKGVLARRTSPTNIGLYLLATVSARDFGFITLEEEANRLEATLDTIDKLELHAGHVLNWYDTSTLAPLAPRYVSTVDSGNLAAHLWTVASACREVGDAPVVSTAVLEAALDAAHALEQAHAAEAEAAPEELARLGLSIDDVHRLSRQVSNAVADPPKGLAAWHACLEACIDAAAKVDASVALGDPTAEISVRARTPGAPASTRADDVRFWAGRAVRGLTHARDELLSFAPWAARRGADAALEADTAAAKLARAMDSCVTLRDVERLPAIVEPCVVELEHALASRPTPFRTAAEERFGDVRADVRAASQRAAAEIRRFDVLADRSTARADGMRFDMLYDPRRKLFAIGYDVGSGRLDSSYYDLLASEARLASLVAVAKGEVPQEHWFRLGRQLTATPAGRTLVSWSGSMFEYLMPLLVTRDYDETLLHETYRAVILWQREYAARKGTPWGVSECAYNLLDLGLTYQYRAFGAPGLGFKAGLGDDLVIAPYATALAALVAPALATSNLRALAKEGLEGAYGFYDSIDYTAERVPPGHRGVVVKVFMAHHQGMSLVALGGALDGHPMRRRFHADPRVKATALLLQERLPVAPALTRTRADDGAAASPIDAAEESIDVVNTPLGPTRAHLLGNGEFSTMITASGSGWTTWRGLDVTRYREDGALDAWGSFCYLRDVDTGVVWSTAYQPSRRAPDAYEVTFAIDRVTIHRVDGDIQSTLEVVTGCEHAAAVRRVTLANTGDVPRRIEVTSYAEVVLAHRDSDAAHPAFGNMFVVTEAVDGRPAVLAMRRPRAAGEPTPWLAEIMCVESGEAGPLEIETSREAFVGRGRTLSVPLALESKAPLSGTTGVVLDPIVSLRRVLTIPPHGRVRLACTTAVATSRDAALALVETFHDPRAVARAFQLAWTDARVELRYLGISAAQAQRFQRLASAMLDDDPRLRAPSDVIASNRLPKSKLWRLGVSGDLPILLVRLDDDESNDLVREVLQAHEFWRLNGLTVDLVILNEEPGGYLKPRQDQTLAVIRAMSAQVALDQRGGVFLRRKEEMSEDEVSLLQATARTVLVASRGSVARQLRLSASRGETPLPSRPRAIVEVAATAQSVPDLQCFNGLGGFSSDGRAYVTLLRPRETTPAPWCNVISTPRMGFVVSESGAGYTWTDNSQTHRLTPWHNDAVIDPPGEAIYLRDEDDSAIWSATRAPASLGLAFEVRHEQGFSSFAASRGDLQHELSVFVAPDAQVKTYHLVIRNQGHRARRLTVVGYVEWILGASRSLQVTTEVDAAHRAVFARNPNNPFPERVAFFAASQPFDTFTCSRLDFLGRSGLRAAPVGLRAPKLSERSGGGFDACAALAVPVALAPGESREIVFTLGEGDDRDAAVLLADAHTTPARARASRAAAVTRWEALLGAVQVKTPEPSFDLLVNRWLLYQALSCRMWGRSGFYQSGGAFGFRDQLQDALATVHVDPGLLRDQILRAASRQFREGDVQHWWHPESGQGVRTKYSDDYVWLPYCVAAYVSATGDLALLDEQVSFLQADELGPEDRESFGVPTICEGATLYEHCTRALDHSAPRGAHGLPKMGGGDWNDGMNRVGEQGRGESVWLAWFLGATLEAFAAVAAARGDAERASRCANEATTLAAAIEAEAWDGAWYRRAYFDDGAPLGSIANPECSIDAIAQSWAVISGLGDPVRARRAIASSEERLVRARERMILLFTPPFVDPPNDPGYINAYPAGLRENGGQYTHGVLWTVLAHAILGDGDRAVELWQMLSPIHHTETPADVARYRVEPYVVAADVYAARGHEGAGGWTWYTGSAAWMYRIALERILGVRRVAGGLHLSPAAPSGWSRFEITYRHGSAAYHIVVHNPSGAPGIVKRVSLDGAWLPSAIVPLADDARDHAVEVTIEPADTPPSRTSQTPRVDSPNLG